MNRDFKHRHILGTKQFKRSDLEIIFQVAGDMERIMTGERRSGVLAGKILATLFFEPSTRTRMSFECAMQRLGGSCITVAEPNSSSSSKGETLEDTIRIISMYSDIIVIRHPEVGSADVASKTSSIPIINAGDGSNQHPTQALLDSYTIYKERLKISGNKIAIIGDLKYGRTAHSLVYLTGLYEDVEFVFISPDELKMPEKVIKFCKEKNIKYTEIDDYVEGLADCDVAYVTRIQKERFTDFSEYERLKNRFILTKETLRKAKQDITIMHPLPRVNEVDYEIDSLPNAAFFRQAQNGVPIRMALLYLLLG